MNLYESYVLGDGEWLVYRLGELGASVIKVDTDQLGYIPKKAYKALGNRKIN